MAHVAERPRAIKPAAAAIDPADWADAIVAKATGRMIARRMVDKV
jgi:hypothetical protein